MAANRTVIVLAPNGRRQNVKVTINTTILQVLEEVCQKQGYNVNEYDIKHNRQILDLNTIFRFTGLPNNAQLEMVACKRTRLASNVTIGIQPENGERVTCEFSPNITLARALTEIYPNADLERAVLIYMHCEICGREALEKTTLKSLGLNSGKAILRLMYRDPEQLKTQAYVSMPLLPKPVAAVNDLSNSKDHQRVPSVMPHCSKTMSNVSLSVTDTSGIENQERSTTETKLIAENERADVLANKSQEEITSAIEENHSVASSRNDRDDSKKDESITETRTEIQEDVYRVQFLGERNALVFNQAGIQALPKDELPDSFFDLDLHDAKTLMRDAKRRREQLEDAPLLTETQRQLEQDKRILGQLNKYRRTIIRILFPDQFVLQGLFGPLETVQAVKDFIKTYLEDPDCEFTIYTAPPKYILSPHTRLIDENLVPSAIIHYSGQSSLKSSVKEKSTDPRVAAIEAVRSRTTTIQEEQTSATSNDGDINVESRNDHVTRAPNSNSQVSSLTQTKIPKWFKQTFK